MAIMCFKKSIEIDPELPSPYYNLSCVYSIKKDLKNALKFFQKAIHLNPEFGKQAIIDSDLNNIKHTKQFKNLKI